MDESFESDILSDELQEQDSDRKQEQLKEHQFKTDFGRTFSTPHGKRVLWRILSEVRVWHSVFHGKALEMARREGERNVGLFLLEYTSTNLLIDMINENRKPKE